MKLNSIQIHRLADTVGISLMHDQGGFTPHISAPLARQLGHALIAAADDVENRSIDESHFPSATFFEKAADLKSRYWFNLSSFGDDHMATLEDLFLRDAAFMPFRIRVKALDHFQPYTFERRIQSAADAKRTGAWVYKREGDFHAFPEFLFIFDPRLSIRGTLR